MNELINKENILISDLIYEVRGKQVMLDSDLALLYECKNKTKTINQAVNRNIGRFPSDFHFQLTQDEFLNLKSQIGTAYKKSRNIYRNTRYLPYVFTEQGVAMLATVIRTPIAAQMSINIMRAFVSMRKYISNNLLEQRYINNLVLEDHSRIEILENSFKRFEEKIKNNEIYFAGQIYDAYSKIYEIFSSANKELIIIDNYADNTILDIIKKLNINITVITKENNLLTTQDILKYNKQYNNLSVKFNNTFHDRYFILDNSIVYHCGSSINRIGYKTFSITMINDKEICESLLSKIQNI